ncbi:hypothetical protein ACS0TY_002720 [Phlomoides rotata]
MDLGCIDMGCIEKPRKETCVEKDNSPKESVTSATKLGKNSKAKDAVRSSLTALNRLTSQISKPPRRKASSPLNWFPRKKVEPYLKRKIKMLQEVDGMHSTLDETLGDSNPHYSRVLREKMAIREAAEKAMEARKAAMVEASWCRILQAASIESKEAEAQLLKAEVSAAEAIETAQAAGVIMNDKQDPAQNQFRIEKMSAKEGSTNHNVSATFETPFEVDKQVAAAVKAAFINLASCPSVNKDEFKELLRKISENPDTTDENYSDLSGFISECESDAETALCEDGLMKHNKRREINKFSMANIVEMMLGRLQCLKEDQLASLATIVATRGLNAALSETVNIKQEIVENSENHCPKVSRRMSVCGRTARYSSVSRGKDDAELPSLDKFLVKRLTRLEREVLEAKNARKNEASEAKVEVKHEDGAMIPDLGSVLLKRSSKLEKEIEDARNNRKSSEIDSKRSQRGAKHDVADVPSLDKYLVKRLTRLEREVQEAKNRSRVVESTDKTNSEEVPLSCSGDSKGKENEDLNRIEDRNSSTNSSHDEKQEARSTSVRGDYESLDKVLVKHVSRLEKEKSAFSGEMRMKVKRKDMSRELESNEGGLEQVLVQHKSRLEMEKAAAGEQQVEDSTKYSVCRRKARERELQEAWGGLSLGNSIRPHVSRLQREKAAWLKAEEEEKNIAATEEGGGEVQSL